MPNNNKLKIAVTTWFIPAIVFFIISADVLYGIQRYQTYKDFQISTMSNEVKLMTHNIEEQLRDKKVHTRLFTENFSDDIMKLRSDPKNDALKQQLQVNVEYYLGGALRFNIIDTNGKKLITEKNNFTSTHVEQHDFEQHTDLIHMDKNKLGYFFDIYVQWSDTFHDETIQKLKGGFIVSYHPGDLSYTLSQKVTTGNKLFLIKGDVNGTIEMSESGAKTAIKRSLFLSEDELQRIGYAQKIPMTSWILVEVYHQQLFDGHLQKIIIEVSLTSIAIIVLFILLHLQFQKEKKRATQSKLFLANIVDSLPGVVFRAELPVQGELNYSFISSSAEKIIGYSQDELKINPNVLFRATHANDFSSLYDAIQLSALNLTNLEHDYRIIKKGGDYLWVREIAHPIKSANGDIIWNGIILDISELKHYEKIFELHFSALNATTDSILICKTDATIEWANPAFCSLTQFKADELRHTNLLNLLAEQDQNKTSINKAISHSKNWQDELIFNKKDHSLISTNSLLTPVLNENGNVTNFILIIRDLSKTKALETQLLQAQKMESIGQLAAGIAHEINTPTQFVGDNVHFLKDITHDCIEALTKVQEIEEQIKNNEITLDAVSDSINEIINDADLDFIKDEAPAAIEQSIDGLGRIAKIVSAMKDFSHPGSSHQDNMDLNHMIETTVTIAKNEWKYVSKVELDLSKNLPTIPADSQLIGQTILNIIVNAAHAIAEKQQQQKFDGLIIIATKLKEEMLELKISDNGMGISEENQQRIFEPFFTTKEVGKGSGQGLAIAYDGIVNKHKGTINIESAIGKGTTFIIQLPINNVTEES